MATISVLMALMALGVAVSTLVWYQKLAENVTRLRTNVSEADPKVRLAELTSEAQSLHARVEHLRQCWQADTGRLEPALRQLESRASTLEQSCSGWGTVAKDLEGLKDFRSVVEPALQQWQNRIVELERGYSSLSAVSQDLDSLRAFRSRVEHVHAGIQKAFNGYLSGSSSTLPPDEERA